VTRGRGDMDRPLYMISVAAELAGVHPQTLRIYERKELVSPQRSPGGTRLYSQADVDRLCLIQHLTQNEGVNLAGVERIIGLQRELERAKSELEAALLRVRRAEAVARSARETVARHQAVRGAIVRIQHGSVVRREG
jgi:MerR family transcriptional regulator, heat shock protein HspR